MDNNERSLAERAARRDRQAFGQLYDRYVDKIYRYIYFKSGANAAEAEDLTAQVFLKAWEAVGNYRYEGYPFSTWLYRIAHNYLIDHYRTHRETLPLDTARNQSSQDDPVRSAEQVLLSDQIQGALKHLTRDQQQVVILRFLEGYSTHEVAAIMNKDPDAVRALQHRALRALQPWLKEEKQEVRKGAREKVAVPSSAA